MKTKEEERQSTDIAIAEFLAKGKEITKVAYRKSGLVEGETYSSWSKKKPSTSPLAKAPDEDE